MFKPSFLTDATQTDYDQLRKIKQQIILTKKIPVSIILTCSCSAFTTTDWKSTLFLKLFPNCQFSCSLIPSKIFEPVKIPASGQNSEFLQLITCQCKWKQHSCCLVIQKLKCAIYNAWDYAIQMWWGHGNKWGYIPVWQQFPKCSAPEKDTKSSHRKPQVFPPCLLIRDIQSSPETTKTPTNQQHNKKSQISIFYFSIWRLGAISHTISSTNMQNIPLFARAWGLF